MRLRGRAATGQEGEGPRPPDRGVVVPACRWNLLFPRARSPNWEGRERYEEDSLEGRLLRNASERVLINVATVAERLPESYKAGHPSVDWRGLQRMRNLVARHYDNVESAAVWSALQRRIPDLLATLALAEQ